MSETKMLITAFVVLGGIGLIIFATRPPATPSIPSTPTGDQGSTERTAWAGLGTAVANAIPSIITAFRGSNGQEMSMSDAKKSVMGGKALA